MSGDILILGSETAPYLNLPAQTSPSSNSQLDVTAFRDFVRGNPNVLQQMLHNNPPLAEAVLADDPTLLASMLNQQELEKRRHEEAEFKRMQELNSDPLNPEYQKKIAEEIRMGNVIENMEQAMEHIPESFGRVVMLYVDCLVNGTPVKAFVDSGAQQTIMSVQCAERCGIMRLVDTRYQGIAKGVGTARIVGRVHVAPIKLGQSYFPCSFTILDNQGMEFLLGLDMLRRHQCSIDLKINALRIGDEVVAFLPEKDIPHNLLFEGEEESPTPMQTSTQKPGASTPTLPKPTLGTPFSPSSVAQTPYSEDVIKQLMGLGFSREEVLNALHMNHGNAEAAASQLFSTF